jgi:hypothetical protein
MNIDHRNPRLRRGFAFVALAAVLGLAAVGLSQCRMVDDTVTGVDVKSNTAFKSGRSACVHQCNLNYKNCIKTEEARHKAAIKACKALHPTSARKACEKGENLINKNNKKACVTQKNLCKKACFYREGAGSAGL